MDSTGFGGGATPIKKRKKNKYSTMSLLYGVEARFPALFFSTFRVVKQKKKKDASVTLVSNHLFISLYACSMCFTFKRKLPREKPPIFIFAVCEHYCY